MLVGSLACWLIDEFKIKIIKCFCLEKCKAGKVIDTLNNVHWEWVQHIVSPTLCYFIKLGHQDARAHHPPLPSLLGTEADFECSHQIGATHVLPLDLQHPHCFPCAVFRALGGKPIRLWSVNWVVCHCWYATTDHVSYNTFLGLMSSNFRAMVCSVFQRRSARSRSAAQQNAQRQQQQQNQQRQHQQGRRNLATTEEELQARSSSQLSRY